MEDRVANCCAHDFMRDNYVIEPGICLHLTRPSPKHSGFVGSGDGFRGV